MAALGGWTSMDGMSTLLEALPPRLRATRWAGCFLLSCW